jgi:hypothetical protein
VSERSLPDPLSAQLAAPSYVLDLRAAAAAPAARPRARAGARAAAEPAPGVVLVCREGDAEVRGVAAILAKVAIGALQIDVGRLASLSLAVDLRARTLRAGGTLLSPTVAWIRHFSARAIDAAVQGPRETFLRDSWQALIDQVSAVSGAVIGARCPGQLTQLAIASRLGVAVPRTLVVSDPRLAQEVMTAPRLVIKALHSHFAEVVPGLLAGAFPRVVRRDRLDAVAWRPAVPVVVQEFIEHDRELRCYYVASQIYAFNIRKNAPADPWLDPDRVLVEPCEPPETVRAAVIGIAEALGLRYGAFDFLLGSGPPIFLEVNPDGDWRWIEEKTGQAPVTLAVARLVADLHAGHAPGADRLDLIRFLA